MAIPQKYNAQDIQDKWKKAWNTKKTYSFDSTASKTFLIDTPPPTVSGSMHLGHAFSYTQGDIIARHKRLEGNSVFYPFGTDDNGLPTEHLVEKKKKILARKLTRKEFVDICHETIQTIKPEFIQPWIDLGISCDFENSYSTIDKHSTKISQQSFLDLFAKGLVYRKETPSTWCVKCQTAIAQADFENIEKKTLFNEISFHDEKGNDLIIATTRPELLGACVALFAHPEDERYTHLKGTKAKVPLFDYEVPILFDEAVLKDKGTGLMMVCTFGDKEDVEKWHKHNLDLRVIIEKYGKLNELAGPYQGLSIKQAREKILTNLKEAQRLVSQKEIENNTNTHDRCGTEIEFMKTRQWFVNVLDHKEGLLRAVQEINWKPEHMKVRLEHWIENLNWDWSISRQRHFGVPLPVWYEKDTGNIVVAKEEDLPIDPETQTPSWYANPENLIGETDVMDTWATSAVTPQIALNWDEEQLPMDLRMQAHDIIRTWAFYTLVKSKYHHQTIPWKNIMISGFVLDPQGKKMSKSKGNTIDPVGLIEKYGADTVRYMASCVKLGEDVPFKEKYLETGKKLVTKIFNASKFVHMHLEDYTGEQGTLEVIDTWMLEQVNQAVEKVREAYESYDILQARSQTEKVFWRFCDYYLEIVKDRLYKPEVHGDESRKAGQYTIVTTLEKLLQLFSPVLPYITEEIWSWRHEESIHTSTYPHLEKVASEKEMHAGEIAVDVISLGRQEKNKAGKSQKHIISTAKIFTDESTKELFELVENSLKITLSIENIEYVHHDEEAYRVEFELAE